MLACIAVAPGCRKSGTEPTSPVARVQADEAVVVPARQVCEDSCRRLDGCAATLASAYEVETSVVAARFVFDCGSECAGLEGPAKTEVAHLADCVALDDCAAFYTCSTGEPTPVATASFEPAANCDGLCGRVLACRGAGEEESGEIESDCQLRCAGADPEGEQRKALMSCLDQRTCGGFLGCVETWRTGTDGGEGPPPGVSGTCDGLCTRAIQCGAEDENLSESELSELRDTMASTYMECAVQCEKDLHADNRADYDECVAVDDCEAFQKCSDAL